jgi:chlorosome envelope protein D
VLLIFEVLTICRQRAGTKFDHSKTQFNIKKGETIMADEGKIDTMKSFDFAVKSITEAGVNQLNLISNTLQSAVPAVTNAAQSLTDAVSVSVKTVSEAAGTLTGALGELGGAVANLAGAVANAAVSVAQSGVSTVTNAIGSVLPAKKI